jgi:hypothetical protein
LDHLILSSPVNSNNFELTEVQKKMLLKSELDIINSRLIFQEAMGQPNKKPLNRQ